MGSMKKIFTLLILFLFICGCEKDDVCTGEATPRLVIEFYDFENPDNLKDVVNLKITGEGVSNPIATYDAVNKIELPLKTFEDITTYHMVLNSSSLDNSKEDIIQFNYTRKNIYISRACGFKTEFNLNDSDGVMYSSANPIEDKWIQNIEILSKNIQNENETHIKIYY